MRYRLWPKCSRNASAISCLSRPIRCELERISIRLSPLRLAADYAETVGDDSLLALLRTTGERWYGQDLDCPAWGEPSGDDFLSPTLIEAECMRRLLPPERFLPWFDLFLPRLSERLPAALFVPANATDRSDGKIAHLDGLNLSRAWCFRALAQALAENDVAA